MSCGIFHREISMEVKSDQLGHLLVWGTPQINPCQRYVLNSLHFRVSRLGFPSSLVLFGKSMCLFIWKGRYIYTF